MRHFRKQFLAELEDLFAQLLVLAQSMKLVRLGQLALDETKVKANASNHKALSHGHIEKLEAQLREVARREERLKALAEVKAKITARAEAGPKDKDQINLTHEESRIMHTAQGCAQAYSAQAAVDTETMLVIATTVTQQPNDKQQVEPILEALQTLPESLDKTGGLLADNGYFSAANVKVYVDEHIEPLLTVGSNA